MANRYKNEPMNTPEQKLAEARNKIESLEAEIKYQKKSVNNFCKQSQEKNDIIDDLEVFKKEAIKLLKVLELDTNPDEYRILEFLIKHGENK